jgi:autotransporter-associated beta strand protein
LNLQCGGLTSGSAITGTGLLSLGGNINVTNAGLGTFGATVAPPVDLMASRTAIVADDGSAASDLTLSGIISGAFMLTKTGAGALTLSGTNTYSGGTSLNAGTININNTQALGTAAGTFTINGGTIDNTSGAAITTVAYPMTWAGNFTFTGTNNLNLNNATVTMSADAQVTTTGGVLTVGGALNAPTYNFTKSGAGSLYLESSSVTIRNLSIAAGIFKTTSATLAIKGTYSNAGTFTDNLGVVEFSGTAAQSIPANGFSTLINTLKINNAAGVTLNQVLLVNNLDLTAGTINLLSNNLTVNTTISNASSNSYVKTTGTGKLRKNVGNGTTQVFPVGNSAYNSVSIRNNTGSADFFTVRVLDEVYSNGYSAPIITASRIIRTWDINKATANVGAGVNFHLQLEFG